MVSYLVSTTHISKGYNTSLSSIDFMTAVVKGTGCLISCKTRGTKTML